MDETYIKVQGKWTYLYRAVDKKGKTIDFMFSKSKVASATEKHLEGKDWGTIATEMAVETAVTSVAVRVLASLPLPVIGFLAVMTPTNTAGPDLACAADLIKYIEANMQEIKMTASLQLAILNTHIAYFKSSYLTQDLVWEQYSYPTTLKLVLKGNGIIFMHIPVTEIMPPVQPQTDVLINKTGSTNGFSTYVAFIPTKKMGVVILANKSYPLDQRVTAGYKILLRLADKH